ncbi:MAG TPA: hypothetical protein VIH67_13895 [Candidatus Acidoferrum sp.]
MDGNDEQFENYLREFEARRPRAFQPMRQSAPDGWRRLAAAASVMVALGMSLSLVLHSPRRHGLQTVTTAQPIRVPLSIVPLTKLAATDPARLDAELTAASRQVLPDFRGEKSTLRVLAKE